VEERCGSVDGREGVGRGREEEGLEGRGGGGLWGGVVDGGFDTIAYRFFVIMESIYTCCAYMYC